MEKEQPYAYWLHSIEGIGNKKILELLDEFSSPQTIYNLEERELSQILLPKQVKRFIESRKKENVMQNYENLRKKEIQYYPFYHEKYPKRLKEIPDPPAGIFVKGKLPKEEGISIAIIGARNCSEYGKTVAREFGRVLGREDIQVISGMARGIDGISQQSALDMGGSSFAVLGCGVDICYPKENSNLYRMLEEKGGIISEYVPETEPLPQLFPPRNRIISGLADVILVIEARQKSGTFITVDMALEQGKEVYVVPGRITDALSVGCNKLMKQGAGIALGPQDFLEQILEVKVENSNEEVVRKKETISELENDILEILDYYPQNIDSIYEKMTARGKGELTVQEIMNSLMKMMIKGMVLQIDYANFTKKQ